MRLLLADDWLGAPPRAAGSPLGDADLAALYAVPAASPGWLRANFAASVDGAVTGADGRSGSVNTPADHVVFDLLRALSDGVLLGAGTARVEGYGRLEVPTRFAGVRSDLGLAPTLPLAVVTNSGDVPTRLLEGSRLGSVLLVTRARAPGLPAARDLLGRDNVLACGVDRVDLAEAMAALRDRGWRHVLTEGGPQLLGSLVRAGLVDELCLTIAPRVVLGEGSRVALGPVCDEAFRPRLLVEEDGTLMGRWVKTRPT